MPQMVVYFMGLASVCEENMAKMAVILKTQVGHLPSGCLVLNRRAWVLFGRVLIFLAFLCSLGCHSGLYLFSLPLHV